MDEKTKNNTWKKSKKTYGIGISALVVLSLSLGGCVDSKAIDSEAKEKLTGVEIPFQWFKNDVKEVKALEPLKKASDVKLKEEKDIFKKVDFAEKQTEKLSNALKKEGVMASLANGEQLFRYVGSDLLSYKAKEEQLNIKKTAKEIDAVAYQKLAGMTLVGVGSKSNNMNGKELFVDLNVVNDTNKFLIIPMHISLDEKGKIFAISERGKSNKSIHTNVPLTEKSELYTDVLTQFDLAFKELKTYPVTKQWKNVDKGSIISFGQEQGLDLKSSKVLFDAFKSTEGNLGLLAITGFMHTDESVEAKTFFEVTINARNNEKIHYTFVFDRGTNKITELKSGSVF